MLFETMDRIKQLGRLAEDEFAKWATAAEVTKNVSKEDERGWDFIVEFELEEEESARDPRTLDHDLRGVKAFVQVKGTDGTPGYRDLKLSNARSLIADTMSPAFLCVLEFDGCMEPQRAHLVHLGREFTARVLKRLRELPTEEKDRLHKHEIRVRYSSEDGVEMLGAALRSALIGPVQGNPRAYEREKSKLLKEVGYDEVNAYFKFQIETPEEYEGDAVEYISDFVAGLAPELEVAGGKVWEVRFGIPQPSPEEVRGGKIEADRNPKNVILVYDAVDGSETLTIAAKLFRWSAVAQAIPRSQRKIRISAPALEQIFYPNSASVGKFGFSFRLERLEPLNRLQETASLIQLLDTMGQANKKIELSLLLRDDFDGVQKDRILLGRLKCREFIEERGNDPRSWEEYKITSRAVNNAQVVARFCGLPVDLKTSLDRIRRRRFGYHVLRELIQGRNQPMTLTFDNEGDPGGLDIKKEYGLISPAMTQLGNWIVLVAFGVVGTLENVRQEGVIKTRLVGKETRIVHKETHHVSEEVSHSASEFRKRSRDYWEEVFSGDIPIIKLEEKRWHDLRETPGPEHVIE